MANPEFKPIQTRADIEPYEPSSADFPSRDRNEALGKIFSSAQVALEEFVGVDGEKLNQLAIFREIDPNIVSSITDTDLDFSAVARFYQASGEESPALTDEQQGYIRAMDDFYHTGLISMGVGRASSFFTVDNTVVRIDKLKQEGDSSKLQHHYINGSLLPQWRKRLLEGVEPEELKQLHADAEKFYKDKLDLIAAQFGEESPDYYSPFTNEAARTIIEMAYHHLSQMMLSDSVDEPYSLQPEITSAKTAEAIGKFVIEKAEEFSGSYQMLLAKLLFDLSVAVDPSHMIGSNKDFALLYEPMHTKFTDTWLSPRSIATVDLAGELRKNFGNKLIYVQGGFELVNGGETAPAIVTPLLDQIQAEDPPFTLRQGAILCEDGSKLRMKTRENVWVQLDQLSEPYMRAHLAVFEDEQNKIHLYRGKTKENGKNTDWVKLGIITLTKDGTYTEAHATYQPITTSGDLYANDGMYIVPEKSGISSDRVDSVGISTAYYGGGMICVDSNLFHPVRVYKYMTTEMEYLIKGAGIVQEQK